MTQRERPVRFSVFQETTTIPSGELGRKLWQFQMSREPLPDLPFAPRYNHLFNLGYTRWNDVKDNPPGAQGADRIGYHTAYAFIQHQDPNHHDYLDAIRVMWQNYGSGSVGINDQGMREDPFGENTNLQGLAPYPWELETPGPVDTSRPGAVVEILHRRVQHQQLLQRWVIPDTDPENPKMRWYYQLNGLVVGAHDDLGVTAKIIISAMHPAYSYRIQGVNTVGVSVPRTRLVS